MSATPSWDPDLYLRHASERARPYRELVARVPVVAPRVIVDLGCGPGTETAALLARWPEATVVGVDSSATMLERAAGHAAPPRLRFELGDIRTWEPGPTGVDVVLSNAALHWVPGHIELFGRWLGWLRPHGALAFQVPGNFDAPSHRLLRELARSGPWSDRLAAAAEAVDIRSPREYLQSLRALGARVDAWETTYYHVLSGPDPVYEWVRASALGPYLAALDDEARVAFTAAYTHALRAAYPPEPSGETVFPFRRVFVVAAPG